MSEERDEQKENSPEETRQERRARQTSYLKPAKPGEVRNPKGKPRGTLNTKTVIRKILMAKEKIPTDPEKVKNLPSFLKPGQTITQLELMTLALVQKAREGDTTAFNALVDRVDGKPQTKTLVGNDPENPLPEIPAPKQVILYGGEEISFE